MKQENTKKLFTIVTVCFNEEDKISNVLKSVLEQNFSNYEYIIVDGKSTDNTVRIIKSYQELFGDKLYFVSEKDNGLYDAMNKAIEMANGEYVLFVNADDKLLPGVLKKINQEIMKENSDIIYGNSINVYKFQDHVCTKVKKANRNITIKNLGRGMGVVHQSVFVKANIMREIGGFNTDYRIGADWDMLIRCVKKGVSLRYVNIQICAFMTDGISSKIHNKERHEIRKANKLYRFIDWDMIKDYMNIGTMIQVVIGDENYSKMRFYYNKRKGELNKE